MFGQKSNWSGMFEFQGFKSIQIIETVWPTFYGRHLSNMQSHYKKQSWEMIVCWMSSILETFARILKIFSFGYTAIVKLLERKYSKDWNIDVREWIRYLICLSNSIDSNFFINKWKLPFGVLFQERQWISITCKMLCEIFNLEKIWTRLQSI